MHSMFFRLDVQLTHCHVLDYNHDQLKPSHAIEIQAFSLWAELKHRTHKLYDKLHGSLTGCQVRSQVGS